MTGFFVRWYTSSQITVFIFIIYFHINISSKRNLSSSSKKRKEERRTKKERGEKKERRERKKVWKESFAIRLQDQNEYIKEVVSSSLSLFSSECNSNPPSLIIDAPKGSAAPFSLQFHSHLLLCPFFSLSPLFRSQEWTHSHRPSSHSSPSFSPLLLPMCARRKKKRRLIKEKKFVQAMITSLSPWFPSFVSIQKEYEGTKNLSPSCSLLLPFQDTHFRPIILIENRGFQVWMHSHFEAWTSVFLYGSSLELQVFKIWRQSNLHSSESCIADAKHFVIWESTDILFLSRSMVFGTTPEMRKQLSNCYWRLNWEHC